MHISALAGAATAIAFAGVATLVWPALPPIKIIEIRYDPASEIFSLERVVRSSDPIYAPYNILFVDAATERAVKECEVSDYADFGPDEPREQSWPLHDLARPDCDGAMKQGGEYYAVMNVAPIGRKVSYSRTETFTIPLKGE